MAASKKTGLYGSITNSGRPRPRRCVRRRKYADDHDDDVLGSQLLRTSTPSSYYCFFEQVRLPSYRRSLSICLLACC